MKYAMFSLPDDLEPRLGAVADNRIVDVRALASSVSIAVPGSLLELIQSGPAAWVAARAIVEQGEWRTRAETSYPPEAIRWHAPIPRPLKNIFCVGLNYASHIEEASAGRARALKTPDVPVFFTKAPTTVVGPFDPVPWDRSATQELDYEIELGVIMGVRGKNIGRAGALDHVFGYTVINDVSARDLQKSHMQWFKGKSLDGTCPMGPCVVTSDEFGDPQRKRLTLTVDGDTRQNANTEDMIFRVDVILEWLSKGMTLEPGDIIATGTPEGVGLGRTPPMYLKDGEVIEAAIEGIGTIRNRVEAVSPAAEGTS